jgi:hypothetical protein
MISDPLADRVPCAKCGTMIQTTTARATGGICRSCERGRVNCVRCGSGMVRKEMTPDDQQVCRDCRKKEIAAAPKPVEVECASSCLGLAAGWRRTSCGSGLPSSPWLTSHTMSGITLLC